MKIGILTYHDVINYGAFFQAYALKSYIQQQGFECQVINYKNIRFTIHEYLYFLNPRVVEKPQLLRNIIKLGKFKKAQKKLNLTRRIFKAKNLSKLNFDILIIGSDEVWNFRSMEVGYDPVYYSHGFQVNRIISYAPSFGMRKADNPIPKQVQNLLKAIDYVSVRDINSANIMRKISNKPIQITLDPSFLVELEPAEVTPPEKDFILVYGYFDENMINQVLEYSKSVGKKTVSVGYNLPWCDISLDTLSPFQWLGYFKMCDSVITTMFHGMIFSILNQKDFCMFSTPIRQNKVGNFLLDLGLSNRVLDGNESIKRIFAEKIDYSRVNTQLEKKRYQSEKFLLDALQS